MKIVGMLPVFNCEDFIAEVIEHLLSEEIELVVLDNGSTDKTYDICKKFSKSDSIDLLRYKTSTWNWRTVLRMLYHMALTKSPDWVIRSDYDEILESGIDNVTLKEAISQADADGYNLIQFDRFEFFMTDSDNGSAKDIKEKLRFYSWESDIHYRAWKYSPGIRVEPSGGHYPVFLEEQKYRICPRKFVCRHYRFRNEEQAKNKIAQVLPRINDTAQKKMGGFIDYDSLSKSNSLLITNHKLLTKYNEDNNWKYEGNYLPFSHGGKPKTKEELFTSDGLLRNKVPDNLELKLILKNRKNRLDELRKYLKKFKTDREQLLKRIKKLKVEKTELSDKLKKLKDGKS